MKLNEYVKNELPREKLKNYGVEYLSDAELLSILLRTGNKDETVLELSNRILKELGGLKGLSNTGINTLSNIKGIKLSKASILIATFELGKRAFKSIDNIKLNNSKDIYEYYKNEYINEKQELFYVLLFDTKMNLIKRKLLFKGTVNKIEVHPREIFKEAIIESASFIIIMHNHPSGDTTPSEEDINLTNKVVSSGELVGIKVLDHIIISSNSYFSFYENYQENIRIT